MQPISKPIEADTFSPAPETDQKTREIDELIYVMSHDIRGSIRALLELPQWIKEDLEEAGYSFGGPAASSVDLMNRHMQRLDRMLADLLTYSRIGRMQQVVMVDVEAVLDKVLADLTVPPAFEVTRDIRFRELLIGERDVFTLLNGLIQNAFAHHDECVGVIHIMSSFQDGCLELQVADDGPGIAPRFQERVFSPMQTLRPRDEVEGSGMGLTIVRKIAETYGGTAYVDAPVFNRGTAIKVRIPVSSQSNLH